MRIIFSTKEEFEKWVENFATPERYAVYTTDASEIVVKPTKSTKAWNEGYLKLANKEEFDNLVKSLEEKNFTHIHAKRLQFDITKEIAVKIEEE